MKNFFIERKDKIIKIAALVVFGALLLYTYTRITYLFRNTDYDRNHVVGLESENSIDVVYIGGSAAFTYWEPPKAYKDCGFTSYCLATSSLVAEDILPFIKYAEQVQNPKLYVIGIRSFQYYDDESRRDLLEAGVRNASDSLNVLSPFRYEIINSYLKNWDTDKHMDEVSFYFDIAKYHTNYDNLKKESAWKFINNSGTSEYKGCEIYDYWAYMDEPNSFQTNERAELAPNAQKELDKIIAYCDQKQLNALFVVCPYSVTKEHNAIYNTIADEVISHGYRFINANDFYDEMGIDFSNDFYNERHVNANGAEKYTAFLEKYIKENYELPDHRLDENYRDWDDTVKRFDERSNQCKEVINQMVSGASCARNQREDIINTNDFHQWAEYINDYHYSLLVTGDGASIETDSNIDRKTLEHLGFNLDELFNARSYLKVFTDEMHNNAGWEMPEVVDDTLMVQIGQIRYKASAFIDNRSDLCSIKISDVEYSRKDPEGINIVVFDNYYRTVMDSVTLKKQDGDIILVR